MDCAANIIGTPEKRPMFNTDTRITTVVESDKHHMVESTYVMIEIFCVKYVFLGYGISLKIQI